MVIWWWSWKKNTRIFKVLCHHLFFRTAGSDTEHRYPGRPSAGVQRQDGLARNSLRSSHPKSVKTFDYFHNSGLYVCVYYIYIYILCMYIYIYVYNVYKHIIYIYSITTQSETDGLAPGGKPLAPPVQTQTVRDSRRSQKRSRPPQDFRSPMTNGDTTKNWCVRRGTFVGMLQSQWGYGLQWLQ